MSITFRDSSYIKIKSTEMGVASVDSVNNSCKTKYPIILVHGTGFRDRKWLNYWGRIPLALTDLGARVFYCKQDAWGTIEENARVVKATIEEAMRETKADKVNILAHSKGGLEARYVISQLGMENSVATLTTISTPHRGSKTMDFFCRFPKPLMCFIGLFVNLYFKVLGDTKPDFYNACCSLTTAACERFNKCAVDSKLVSYQSYSCVMKSAVSDMFLSVPYLVVKCFDGECDGIVSVESAKWGNFKGAISHDKRRGISHADIVDARRMNIKGFDVRDVYVGIVSELKNAGY